MHESEAIVVGNVVFHSRFILKVYSPSEISLACKAKKIFPDGKMRPAKYFLRLAFPPFATAENIFSKPQNEFCEPQILFFIKNTYFCTILGFQGVQKIWKLHE